MNTRRGNREGSIRLRPDGRWEARVRLPNGRRRSYFGSTRTEVARRLNTALKAITDGLPIPGERLTFGTHCKKWLESVESEVRPGTWRRYEQLMRDHALPDLGRVRLTRLTPDHLRGLFKAKLEAGLAPATVRQLRAVIRLALQRALLDGLVLRNVATLAKPARTRQDQGEAPAIMRTLSREQAIRLLELAAADRLEALYWLAITTGMRQGELFALRWRDVDLSAGTVRVVGTLQRTAFPRSEEEPDSALRITAPKTPAARRTIQLTPETVAVLRRHKARQAEERLRNADVWDASLGLVFTTEVGTPLEAGNVLRRSYWPLLFQIGLADKVKRQERRQKRGKVVTVTREELRPRLRFHDLRHTSATLLLEAGVHPSIVAATLGHSRTSTTLNVYSHVTPTLAAAAAQAMGELLRRG